MKKVIHKADTRGHSQYDWLDSYHTFSFDEYFDSDRINFGALRVLNDDKVAPGQGFQTHPHKNMEIISIPLKGHLQHGCPTARRSVRWPCRPGATGVCLRTPRQPYGSRNSKHCKP